ncbi:MAG: hypothetical protein ACXVFR_08390 [Nocardioidaceae bacterium]
MTDAGLRWHRGDGRDWALMVVGAVVLAGVTVVVLPRGIAYDPWSWLIWGREIGHLGLDTRHAATAVKPLPIFVDTLLAPAGSAAPILWLLVARAGTVLSLVLAFRVGHRIGGVVAGTAATVGLAMADQFLGYLFVSGMSEPMATAAVLAAVDSHLRSHRRAALGFLIVAGLLRPEAWPAVLGYSLWLAYAGGAWRRVLGALVAVAVPAVWFGIDWLGSRQLSRSAEAATHYSQGGPLLSREPGLATLGETWHLMSGPVVVLFLLGFAVALRAWRRSGRPGPLAWLGMAAIGWLVVDALLAQGRFATGAPRYLLPGVGLACVVAGSLVADVVRTLRNRLVGRRVSGVAPAAVAVGLVAVCAPRIAYIAGAIEGAIHHGYQVQALQTGLPNAVAVAGGRGAVLRCGHISTRALEVPLLTWQLDVPLGTVGVVHPGATGTVIESGTASFSTAELGHYRELARPGTGDASRTWTVLTTCPAAGREVDRELG